MYLIARRSIVTAFTVTSGDSSIVCLATRIIDANRLHLVWQSTGRFTTLIKSIPDVTLVEMERSRSTAMCCGAGGGCIWMEEKEGRRVNHVRTQQAIDTGADIVAVACPFCIQMFEDGISALQPDEAKRMRTFDISELLEVSVVTTPRAQREVAGASGDD